MADIHVFPDAPEGTPKANFVHLHVHSDYSLLDSCCKLDSLIAKAKRLNMPALAITDHGNMFGVLNFEHICHANGINPIVGCEFYVGDDHTKQAKTKYGKNNYHLILLCENETGYKNMSWLCSNANTEGQYFGKPRIDFEMLKERHEGLICLTACIAGELPQTLMNDTEEAAEELILKYKNLFGPDHYYIELQDHGLPEQKDVNPKLIKLAKKLDVPLVVTNDIHYMEKEDAEAQDALRCIGFKQLLSDKDRQTMGDGRTEWYFKTEEEMRQLFPELPEAYENTIKIANMCNLTIHQYSTPELKNCLPRFELPKQFQKHEDYTKNQDDYVRYIVEKGLRMRYPEITPEIRDRAEYELGIIFKMGFSGYFLIVWEFINWAKEHKKPIGPGRGSGAGSLVAYSMTITDIDPFRFGLIFERFLNPERVSMPDFDIDMDFDYRQDIIEHTRDLYGEEQVGHIVTFGTLKPKQCIADVGRVLNIPLSEVNMLKSCIPDSPKAKLKDAFAEPTEKFPDGGKLIPYADDPRYQKLFELARKLEGVNRNTGLHASGMVISLTPLPDWAPIFKDPKTGEVGVQYTMDIIEPCGLVKFDYLGLKTLSLIRYAENIINKHKKTEEAEFDCSKVSESDPKAFELFQRGDSVAVFQFESPGMQKILREFKPEKLEDLVALNALYRPGPMDYIPNYIDGKWKPETIHYPDPCLEGILKETYGVMVYQEQVMQVSQKIAGFSLGGADMLRRAMGKKKPEVMAAKQVEFEEGAVKQGFTKEHAAEIFNIMIPFAGYGFNKSHAAAYSVLAYRTGFLKANYPAEFMAANLTNEITSTDGLPIYIEEARRMGISVDAPDVNRSDVVFDVVDGRIVFGLKGIKGMGEGAARAIVAEREENGPYKSFMDFVKRAATRVEKDPETGIERIAVNKKAIEVLIKTGGFDFTGKEEGLNLNRPTLLANLDDAVAYANDLMADKRSGQGDLFGDLNEEEKVYIDYQFKIINDLPKMELLNMEKDCIGCYVSGHPLDDYKLAIDRSVTLKTSTYQRAASDAKAEYQAAMSRGVKYWQYKTSCKVHTALGMVTELHPHTTKSGEEMAFLKLSDYDGAIDCVIFAKTWGLLRSQIENMGIYAFKGRLDGSKDSPSFQIESVIDPKELENHSVNSIHIQLHPNFSQKEKFTELSDFLFDKTGNCSLYFHIDTGNNPYIVKAGNQLMLNPTEENINILKEMNIVKDVWTE